jgi:hypothetical protein
MADAFAFRCCARGFGAGVGFGVPFSALNRSFSRPSSALRHTSLIAAVHAATRTCASVAFLGTLLRNLGLRPGEASESDRRALPLGLDIFSDNSDRGSAARRDEVGKRPQSVTT